jgi:hypothetical protein
VPDPHKFRTALFDPRHDRNHRFSDVVSFLEGQGFRLRIKGDHHIFARSGLPVLINLQPEGNKAKAYQIRQVRKIFETHKL